MTAQPLGLCPHPRLPSSRNTACACSRRARRRARRRTGPDRFGLLGLLGVIRMTDPDLTTLALGTDLTTLGLNLNSPENVFKTFASPWADTPLRPEPDFKARARGCTPGQRLRSEAGACVSVWHPFRRLSAQRSLAQNLKLPVRSYPIMGR